MAMATIDAAILSTPYQHDENRIKYWTRQQKPRRCRMGLLRSPTGMRSLSACEFLNSPFMPVSVSCKLSPMRIEPRASLDLSRDPCSQYSCYHAKLSKAERFHAKSHELIPTRRLLCNGDFCLQHMIATGCAIFSKKRPIANPVEQSQAISLYMQPTTIKDNNYEGAWIDKGSFDNQKQSKTIEGTRHEIC